jgi:hypothetical protein
MITGEPRAALGAPVATPGEPRGALGGADRAARRALGEGP